MGGQRIIISRTGFTAELGWEYYVFPDTDCVALWKHLMQVGAPCKMVHSGLDSMDIRRIEAGILNSGSDFVRRMSPFDVGLGAHVDMDKPDFIVKAALEGVTRQPILHGLHCAGSEPMAASTATVGDKEVGYVSATAWSPFLRHGIGYLRLSESGLGPGGPVTVVGVDGKNHPAQLVEIPFYDREKRMPRGLAAIPASLQKRARTEDRSGG